MALWTYGERERFLQGGERGRMHRRRMQGEPHNNYVAACPPARPWCPLRINIPSTRNRALRSSLPVETPHSAPTSLAPLCHPG